MAAPPQRDGDSSVANFTIDRNTSDPTRRGIACAARPDLDRKKRTRAILIALTVLFLPLAIVDPWSKVQGARISQGALLLQKTVLSLPARILRGSALGQLLEKGAGGSNSGSAGKGDSPSSGQVGKSSANSDE
jgi:hypothetical protein